MRIPERSALGHTKAEEVSELVTCFEIDGARYIAGVPTVPFGDAPDRVTVLPVVGSSVTEEWLDQALEELRADHVFKDAFLKGVLFVSEDHLDLDIAPAVREVLKGLGNQWLEIRLDQDDLSPGPHVMYHGALAPAYRLYDDSHSAFLHSLLPGPGGELVELKVAGNCPQTPAVAIPSRFGKSSTPELPLKGFRIAVKDIFQIANVRTSVCNKAYYELYPPPEKTAACVELLIEAGASIVGTTKLASFAATEEPVECVDYQAPWNPRADGYQSPAGSSSGSGAAMAAYEWLDITIGSDTSGSGRRPGHWNGCYAMRPTHGVLPEEGYIASFRQFDVPTFFGRDLQTCKYFTKSWYGKALKPPPTKGAPVIVYPTDYMSLITNQVQLGVIDDFVKDLEASLGVVHEKISFNELWDSATPKDANGLSLQEYMKNACRNSFFHDDYHSFDKFRQDYFEKHGKKPYVSPPVRWQWEISSKITQQERDTAVDKLEVYRKWFMEHVMREGNRDTIVIIPIENISPRYRDDPPLPHFNPVGVPMLFVSPILGAPELTVPIGHSPFLSKVTGKTENLPIAISILGEPGRDLELFDIVSDCLRKSGRPSAVKSGTSDMF